MAGSRHNSRATCPSCGGDVHPIAGRCKHCKADLIGSHRHATAVVALPTIAAASGDPAPILPPRPPDPVSLVAARSARWPIAVIVVSILATGVALAVMAWPNESSASAISDPTNPNADRLPRN